MNTAILTSNYTAPIQNTVDTSHGTIGENAASSFEAALTKASDTNAAASVTLHGKRDANEGERCVGSWAGVQTGISTSVYRPDDFSEDNPYYRVKIWKPDGTTEERSVDVMHYNPKSADSFEQYAYSCYLSKEKGVAITDFVLTDAATSEAAMYEKRDWLRTYKEQMQQQYAIKDYEGYFRYKRIYELLMMQSQDLSTSGINSMEGATEAYTSYLQSKYGSVRIESVGRDQKSLERIAGTMRGGDVIIAPNILEKMATDSETAQKIEGIIDRVFENIPIWQAEAAAKGLRFESLGVIVHEDGTVTHICGSEDSPERVAEVRRINQEKRKREAQMRTVFIQSPPNSAQMRRLG